MLIDNLLVYTQPLRYRITLCKPTNPYTKLSELGEAFNIEFEKTLKEVNKVKFTFSIPYYINDEINNNWNKIQTGYVVYVEKYSPESGTVFSKEYMLIQSIENNSDDKYIKNITCVGLEIELNKKILNSFSGVKRLYVTPDEIATWVASETYPTRQDLINSGILNVITNLNPSWSVGEIDSDIAAMYRTIDTDGEFCLDFLINTVQNSFVCLFFFDTINKTISCRNLTHLGTNHGFFVSDNNYIKTMLETVDFDYVVTKLYIYGYEDLTIRSVSVTGEDYLLDLSYYRNLTYMSQSLLDALDNYDVLLANNKTTFQGLLTQLNTNTATLNNLKSQLALLDGNNGTLVQLNTERDKLIATEESTSEVDAQITATKSQITTLKGQITTTQTTIDGINAQIQTLQNQLLFANNFTPSQISELDHWIIEKKVSDTSYTDAQELYDQGVQTLSQINQPSIQFDIDIVDLFDCVECQLDWNKISLGDVAYVKYENFNIDVQLRLISYTHNYEENKLTLTFANRNNLNDPSMILAEVLKTSASTATTLDINQYKYLQYINSGDQSTLNAYIKNILNLAAQGATAGGNNEISMDARGIIISDPTDTQKQVRIMYNGIYCTTDGWTTAKWALTGAQGINAEVIRGILGEFVTLYANQIIMNGDNGMNQVSIKMTHPSGDYTELKPDGLLRYTTTPIYNEVPVGTPSTQSFAGATIASLQAQGWELSGCVIDSNRLYLNSASSYARINKYITKDNTTFNFTFSTVTDSSHNMFCVDNNTYDFGSPITSSTFQTQKGTITLNKGWHSFSWSLYYGIFPGKGMYIENILFEQSPVNYVQSGSYSTTGSTYNYMTYSGSGSTPNTMIFGSEDAVPDTTVQLPDEFKGKNFTIDIFLQDTGEQGTDYCLNRILVEVVAGSIDYTNARFKARARTKRTYYGLSKDYSGSYSLTTVTYWRGCDFTYIVRC